MSDTVQLGIQANITIKNIPWTSGMNVQQVLEAAYNTFVCPPAFPELSYWISYFGASMGYMVTMMDGTAQMGNNYWILYINNVIATAGIDSTIVNSGDQVQFNYEPYSSELHGGTIVAKIHALIKG